MIVADLVDRVLRTLEPPDETWVRTALTAPVDAGGTTLPVDVDMLTPEERRIAPGVLIEVGSEQMTVVSASGSPWTVRRGQRGTTAATYDAGATVTVRPPFTRLAVFEAVADDIPSLSPPLMAHCSDEFTADRRAIIELDDSVLSVQSVRDEAGRLLEFTDLGSWDGGRAVRLASTPSGPVVVSWRSRLLRPRTEGDVLAALGMRREWGRITVAGVLAQLMAGKPMSTAQREFVAAQLRTDGYPVETPNRVRDALIRYREYLLEQAAQALVAEHPPSHQVVLP